MKNSYFHMLSSDSLELLNFHSKWCICTEHDAEQGDSGPAKAMHWHHRAWPHLVPESCWAQARGTLLLSWIEREIEGDEWGGETWGIERENWKCIAESLDMGNWEWLSNEIRGKEKNRDMAGRMGILGPQWVEKLCDRPGTGTFWGKRTEQLQCGMDVKERM